MKNKLSDEELLALHEMVAENFTTTEVKVMLVSSLMALANDDYYSAVNLLKAQFEMFKGAKKNGQETS